MVIWAPGHRWCHHSHLAFSVPGVGSRVSLTQKGGFCFQANREEHVASALFNLGRKDETRNQYSGVTEHISKQNAYSPLGKDLEASCACVLV